MNGSLQSGSSRRMGFVAVFMLSIVSLKANPVAEGEGPLALIMAVPVTLAILLEAICVSLILLRSRKPHLFILWLMGMHLLTYPIFLGLLWLLHGMHPALAVGLGEGAIIIVEGGLIYLMCRFVPSRQSPLPAPSVSKSLFASLVGNICSAAAFPLLLRVFGLILSAVMPSDLD